jgi:hypothetical protein
MRASTLAVGIADTSRRRGLTRAEAITFSSPWKSEHAPSKDGHESPSWHARTPHSQGRIFILGFRISEPIMNGIIVSAPVSDES